MTMFPTSFASCVYVTDATASEVWLVVTARKYRVCGVTVTDTRASAGVRTSHGKCARFTVLVPSETAGNVPIDTV